MRDDTKIFYVYVDSDEVLYQYERRYSKDMFDKIKIRLNHIREKNLEIMSEHIGISVPKEKRMVFNTKSYEKIIWEPGMIDKTFIDSLVLWNRSDVSNAELKNIGVLVEILLERYDYYNDECSNVSVSFRHLLDKYTSIPCQCDEIFFVNFPYDVIFNLVQKLAKTWNLEEVKDEVILDKLLKNLDELYGYCAEDEHFFIH